MAAHLRGSENGIVESMKTSIVLSTQPSTFSALAFKGNLPENLVKIKALGFDAVELAVRDPDQLDLHLLRSVLEQKGLPVSAIATGQAYVEEHLSLTDPQREIRQRALQRLKSHAALAERFKALVIVGLMRGRREAAIGFETVQSWLVDALKECASAYEETRFALEPINRYETNLVNDVQSGLELLERVGKRNVGLLLDTFHMNIEEPSITESIKTAKGRLFHFHVADSNRWCPGAGHIDFPTILDTLEKTGYTGYVSAEILPLPDPDSAAKRTIEYLRRL
jgi:sugar phosphate isomerase/epimerase